MTDDLQKELEHLRTKVSIQDIALPRLTEAMVKSQARVKQLETDGNLMAMNLRILEGQLREANKKIAEAEADAERLSAQLDIDRRLVSEAAMTGFRWDDGDWAERLFENNGQITAALAAHTQRVNAKDDAQ